MNTELNMPKLIINWDYKVLAATKELCLVKIDKESNSEYVVWKYDKVGNCYSGYYTDILKSAQETFAERAFHLMLAPGKSQEIQDYIDIDGANCLFCGSQEIEVTGMPEWEEHDVHQEVVCNDCDRIWTDIYTLTDVEFEEGEKQ